MKVKVNEKTCIGCGACCAVAGEIFEINDKGLSHAVVETVPEDQKEACQEAIESCPTSAIEKVEE